jgi:hypothetical protein
MAQQNIDYGTFPNDPSADAIRIAFEKVQNNFTELYGNLSAIAGNVSAITAGTGIITSGSTGNVTIDSIFSSLTVHSDTIEITGIGGFIPPGGIPLRDYTVNNSTNTLFLEIGPSSNLSFDNLSLTSNLTVNGSTISSANANIVLGNGNIILSNGSFTGNIISVNPINTVQFVAPNNQVTGDTNYTYDSANSRLSVTGGNIITDTVTAGFLMQTVNLSVSNVATIGNTATVGSLVSLGNISGLNAELTGNIVVTGNAQHNNLLVAGNISAALFQGNGSGITDIVASNITSGIIPTSVLSGNYSISISGSALTSDTVVGALQSNITGLGTLNTLTVSGSTTTGSLISAGTISATDALFSGNLSTNQLAVNTTLTTTDANFANSITTNTLFSNSTATVNDLVSNNTIQTNSITATGNINANNITTSGSINGQELTILGNTQLAQVVGGNFVVANLSASNTLAAIELIVNQVTASGNITGGNIFANTGTISATSGVFTGPLTSTNGLFSGNVAAGNLISNSAVSSETLIVNNQISSNNIVNTSNITTANLQSISITTDNVTSNTLVVSTVSNLSVIKFTGLVTDPISPVGGEFYYNSATGKLRIYNGVLNQWQNLN